MTLKQWIWPSLTLCLVTSTVMATFAPSEEEKLSSGAIQNPSSIRKLRYRVDMENHTEEKRGSEATVDEEQAYYQAYLSFILSPGGRWFDGCNWHVPSCVPLRETEDRK